MDSISSLFQCNWCHSCFVDPVSLPCGDSICEKHTDELRAANWRCVLCGEVHKLADGERFPVSKLLRKMLEMNLAKLDLGPIYKEAKQQVESLESKSVQMKNVIEHPGDYVSTITTKHRNQVDLGREEVMNLVEEVYKVMNLKITDYESEAVENIEDLSSEMTEWTQSADGKIASWKQSLNELVVNEEQWKKITSDAEQLSKDFDSRLNDATLDPHYNATNLSKRIALDTWIELSKRVQTPDPRDKRSVLVRDVSKITQAQSWNSIKSECFTIQGFEFYFYVQFQLENGKMALGAYLYSKSDHEEQSVSISWKFKVFGKYYQVIVQEDIKYEFKYKIGYGFSRLIFLNDILAHSALDPQLDFVRVHVEIDEKSFSLKSRPPPIRQSVLISDVSKIAEAQSWNDIDSEIFTVKEEFKFFLRVKFVYSGGRMHLGASLQLQPNDTQKKVKLMYIIKVFGLNDEKISSVSTDCELGQEGWDLYKIISLREIMAHQAYNAKEDSVRVEVLVYEDRLKVIEV